MGSSTSGCWAACNVIPAYIPAMFSFVPHAHCTFITEVQRMLHSPSLTAWEQSTHNITFLASELRFASHELVTEVIQRGYVCCLQCLTKLIKFLCKKPLIAWFSIFNAMSQIYKYLPYKLTGVEVNYLHSDSFKSNQEPVTWKLDQAIGKQLWT